MLEQEEGSDSLELFHAAVVERFIDSSKLFHASARGDFIQFGAVSCWSRGNVYR